MTVESALARLIRGIQEYHHGDETAVLEPQAAADAAELRGHTPDAEFATAAVRALAWWHWCRYQALPAGEDQMDLRQALDLFATLPDTSPPVMPGPEPAGHRPVPEMRTQQASILLLLAKEGTESRPLKQAISWYTEALADAPADDPDRAALLTNLAVACNLLAERADDPDTALPAAAQGVNAARQAVAATPLGAEERAGRLSNLSAALQHCYELTDDEQALTEAVDRAREAVTATRAGSPHEPAAQSVLGAALELRYEQHLAWSDITGAVAAHRRAVAVASPGDPRLPILLSALSTALRARGERAAADAAPTAREDLDEAVLVAEQAVAATAEKDPELPSRLADLSLALQARDEHTGDTFDPAASAAARRAVASSQNRWHRAVFQSGLSGALHQQYEMSGSLTALGQAIDAAREAVRDLPAGDPNRAGYLTNVGVGLALRYGETGNHADLTGAREAWARARSMTNAPVAVRLDAARHSAQVTAHAEGPAAAVDAYAEAVSLLPVLALTGSDRADQQYLLRTHAGSMARHAAACAIAAGQPERAVELLEAGRGVLWSQQLDIRTDLAQVARADPELAAELYECRTVLDRSPGRPTAGPDGAVARRRAALRFRELLAEVRAWPATAELPNPERFGGPPSIRDLLPPGPDPVVLVNVSYWRCDALAVSGEGVRPIPLPELCPDEVVDRANRYLSALQDYEDSRRTRLDQYLLDMTVTATLTWLWDAVAEPILSELGFRDTPEGAWPRLWWCPTGALTVLPLHAAGHHHLGTATAVCDRVISSYTPTLRTLHHLRASAGPPPARMLVVALPRTPDRPPLPGAEAECASAGAWLDDAHRTVLHGRDATRDRIHAELGHHQWLHAACHGEGDLLAPAEGGLLAHDWQTAGRVSVTDLAGADATGGEFAFLSACQTALGGVNDLDEVITVAAAMQYAGWRHVVATLWSVFDQTAACLADDVYAQLAGPDGFHVTDTAAALHAAVRRLRDAEPGQPTAWAPFIHAGL